MSSTEALREELPNQEEDLDSIRRDARRWRFYVERLAKEVGISVLEIDMEIDHAIAREELLAAKLMAKKLH